MYLKYDFVEKGWDTSISHYKNIPIHYAATFQSSIFLDPKSYFYSFLL